MTKRAALWIIVGLLGTAAVPGIITRALGQGEDVGGPPATPRQDNATEDTTAQQPPQAPTNQQQPPADQPQGDQGVPEGGGPGPQQEPTLFQRLFIPMVLVGFVLLWIFGSRKSRTTEKKRQEMLSNIKKGDKVTSIGGIIGTVVDVRDNEVVVKVDDTANTRLRFIRKAISHIGPPAEEAEGQKK